MNGDRVIKVLLCGSHGDCDRSCLDHLVDTSTNHVKTGYLFLTIFLSANELHHRLVLLLVGAGKRVEHVGESRFVADGVFVTILLFAFLFSNAYRGNWGMRENYGSDVVIGHLELGLVVEKSLGENTTSSDGDRSKIALINDITNGINSGNIGVLEIIDNYGTFVANSNTSVFDL